MNFLEWMALPDGERLRIKERADWLLRNLPEGELDLDAECTITEPGDSFVIGTGEAVYALREGSTFRIRQLSQGVEVAQFTQGTLIEIAVVDPRYFDFGDLGAGE